MIMSVTSPVDAARATAIHAARQAHPERFRAALDLPKILTLPNRTWINDPAKTGPEPQAGTARRGGERLTVASRAGKGS